MTKVHRRFPQWRESVQFARSPLDEPFSGPLHLREMPVNALICLLLLESRDNRDSMAERVGFEPSVTFRIPLWELVPSLAHYSVPKKKILNQREFLGLDSAFRNLSDPFMRDVSSDTSMTSDIIGLWAVTFRRGQAASTKRKTEIAHPNHISRGKRQFQP